VIIQSISSAGTGCAQTDPPRSSARSGELSPRGSLIPPHLVWSTSAALYWLPTLSSSAAVNLLMRLSGWHGVCFIMHTTTIPERPNPPCLTPDVFDGKSEHSLANGSSAMIQSGPGVFTTIGCTLPVQGPRPPNFKAYDAEARMSNHLHPVYDPALRSL